MTTATQIDEPRVALMAGAIATNLAGHGANAAIGVLCPNSAAFVAARDAITLLELPLVPLNPKLAPPELTHMIATSQMSVLLVTQALSELATAALEGLPDGQHPQVMYFSDAVQVEQPARFTPTSRVGATIVFTSGTTGSPKGCLRTETQEQARCDELIATYSLNGADVHLMACPLTHSAPGIFLRAGRRAGASTWLLPSFEPIAFLHAVERTAATVFFLVPTQYRRLLALPPQIRERYDISSVRAAIVAGAPVPPQLTTQIRAWLGHSKLWEFYGSTETGTVSVRSPGAPIDKLDSVGQPPPGVEIQIRPTPQHDDLPGIGEVYVRSRATMAGYLPGHGGTSMTAHDDDGFLSAGDVGYIDDDGYLFLVDRKHDVIISGGVNIYPAEVERALGEHPDILDAMVFGVPHEDWGEAVVCVVALTDGSNAEQTVAALPRFLEQRLARFKRPKRFIVADRRELPYSASGKPQRRRAAERFTSTR